MTISASASGDVTAQNIGTETTLVLTTISGSVLGTGLKVRALEAGSVSGNVRITLSGTTGFELDADTFSGSVRSDVPVTLRTMGRTEQNRRGSNRAIRGSYGDASAYLSVRSHSGTVVITKK